MVLERILSPKSAEEHMYIVFLAGAIISAVSVFTAYFVFVGSSFESAIGIFVTFFITIAILPFMINLGRYDEYKEEVMLKARKTLNIFARHKTIIRVYMAFFFGVVLSLSIIYVVLPQDIVDKVFYIQDQEVNRIRGAATLGGTFFYIFPNNIGVLMLAFIFSFIFGAGAIYILAWNSTILAYVIGDGAKSLGVLLGIPSIIGIVPAALPYLPHGIPEFLAYFMGAIAGGILSIAVTKHRNKYFWFVIEDSLKFLGIAVMLLVVGGVIESFLIVGV